MPLVPKQCCKIKNGAVLGDVVANRNTYIPENKELRGIENIVPKLKLY